MNYKQVYAIKKANESKILEVCPDCPRKSGIYFLLRREAGFKYAYIGQAKNLLERLGSHLSGYQQHIDRSLKKHGLYSEENPTGWEVNFLQFPEGMLDEMEQKFIKKYANAGWQMRNATAGGQGEGKHGLDNSKPSRTYYDGLEQGKKNTQRFIADLFKKHLDFVPKKQPPNKYQIKAMEKFKDFLDNS